MSDNSEYDSNNSYWCCTSSSKYKHLSHSEYTHPNPNLSETDLYQHEQDLNTNPNKYGDTDGEDKNHMEWEVNEGYEPEYEGSNPIIVARFSHDRVTPELS